MGGPYSFVHGTVDTLVETPWGSCRAVPRFESGFLPLPGHVEVLGVEFPLCQLSSQPGTSQCCPPGAPAPDPADDVVRPMNQLLDDILIGALQKQSWLLSQ